MAPSDVTAIFDELGGAKIDAYGWTYGPMRVERGGGIAGHLNEFWLRFPGTEIEPMGPYKTKRQLRAAIRNVIIAAIKVGCALVDAVESFSSSEE